MITMEFDEMRKIWDSQNNEFLYSVNEKALHNRILSKQNQARHITRASEILAILVNGGVGGFLLGTLLMQQKENVFMYLLSAWMIGSALYVLVSRLRRLREDSRFDRSVHGDLAYAISVATYQVRLSHLMRWNVLPIAVLVLLGGWESGKSVWFSVAILIFVLLTFYAAGWEHNIYKARKRELEVLQKKLENEEPDGRL